MKDKTLDVLTTILKADETVTPEEIAAILSACRSPQKKRKLLTAKQAMEILDVSRPTLRNYAKSGLVEQVNISSRKVRFDEASVNRLANLGDTTNERFYTPSVKFNYTSYKEKKNEQNF